MVGTGQLETILDLHKVVPVGLLTFGFAGGTATLSLESEYK